MASMRATVFIFFLIFYFFNFWGQNFNYCVNFEISFFKPFYFLFFDVSSAVILQFFENFFKIFVDW